MSIFPLYFWTNAFVKKTAILDTVPGHGFQFHFLRLVTWTQPHFFGHETNTFVKDIFFSAHPSAQANFLKITFCPPFFLKMLKEETIIQSG